MKAQSITPETDIVHSDVLRLWALIYVIDTGGDNVVTTWYQEKGKPLNRPRLNPDKTPGVEKQTDTGFVDYNNLISLDNIKVKKNQWVLINVQILHDVDNITGTRKALSISFYPDRLAVVDKLLELY